MQTSVQEHGESAGWFRAIADDTLLTKDSAHDKYCQNVLVG